MQPTFTQPTPVIGNHPAGCSCSTCVGGRKRLLASPFVQRLIADLGVLHEQLYKATSTKTLSAPELEERVLTLTDALESAKEDNGVLTRTLEESRKIGQEREKQFAAEKKESVKWARKAEALAQEKLRVIDDLARERTFSCTYRDQAAKQAGLLSRISGTLSDCCEWDELPRAVETLLQRCNQYGERSDAMGQANTHLQQERAAVVSQLREAHAALKLANASISSLERDKDLLKESIATAERRGELTTAHALFVGNLRTIAASVLCALAAFLVGRWAQ